MKTMRKYSHHGMTLIEIAVYMSVLFIILGIALQALTRFRLYCNSLARNTYDMKRTLKAGEQWRADIHRAIVPPRFYQGILTIVLPHGQVQYRFQKNNVMRRTNSREQWELFLAAVAHSHMRAHTLKHVTYWSWEVQLQGNLPGSKPLFSFLAVRGHHE